MTTEATLNDMNRQIGMLIASVDGLRRDFATTDVKQDQRQANLHRRLDDLIDQIGEIEMKVAAAETRIGQIEGTMKNEVIPAVESFAAWKQRGIGVLATATAAGSLIGVGISYLWAEIVAKLTRAG